MPRMQKGIFLVIQGVCCNFLMQDFDHMNPNCEIFFRTYSIFDRFQAPFQNSHKSIFTKKLSLLTLTEIKATLSELASV